MCYTIDIDDEVSADPNKVVMRELQKQVLQAGLDIVFALSDMNRAVFPFDFSEPHILLVDPAELQVLLQVKLD